jgi:hypothetical protein
MATSLKSRGFTTQVTLDASSSATVQHGAGKKPTAVVVQTSGPGQLATVQPSSFTETSFRVKFNWHDGTTFKLGTKLAIGVIVTYEEEDVVDPGPDPEPGARCTAPVFTTTTPSGEGSNWSDPNQPNWIVNNEVWNGEEAGPQKISVCSARSWFVESTQPKPGSDPHSIKSYPDTQVLYQNPTIGSLVSSSEPLVAKWAHEAPARGEWNFSFDIWHKGWSKELMIWTDHRYGGDRPAPLPPGDAQETATVTIDEHSFVAWNRSNGNYIALVMTKSTPSGQLDLKKVYQKLIELGWMATGDTLQAIDYGVEIADTKGVPEKFYLNDFDITKKS